MPAKNLIRVVDEGGYSHIYNRGVEGRVIFADEHDYGVFLGYVREYLSPPAKPESLKKSFTVKGKTFQGSPHLPKNYYNQVELVAYSLKPDHFHLVLLQNTTNSVQSFLKSLGTRYSMYFNKKYFRSGALFEGPYKSAHIKDPGTLVALTAFIHQNSDYSSILEYLGQRETPWVKKHLALACLGGDTYEAYFEKCIQGSLEGAIPEEVTLEPVSRHLERRNLTEDVVGTFQAPRGQAHTRTPTPPIRLPEFGVIVALFLVLTVFGVRNIRTTSSEVSGFALAVADQPQVFSASVEATEPGPDSNMPTEKAMAKIAEGENAVRIYLSPSVYSEVVITAQGGDAFEKLSCDTEWCRIGLSDGVGYVLARYIERGN